MTTVQKGVRVRLYPTEEQEVLFNKTFGCVRTVNSLMNKHNTFLLKMNVLRT